jgi:hypothetical protein
MKTEMLPMVFTRLNRPLVDTKVELKYKNTGTIIEKDSSYSI